MIGIIIFAVIVTAIVATILGQGQTNKDSEESTSTMLDLNEYPTCGCGGNCSGDCGDSCSCGGSCGCKAK